MMYVVQAKISRLSYFKACARRVLKTNMCIVTCFRTPKRYKVPSWVSLQKQRHITPEVIFRLTSMYARCSHPTIPRISAFRASRASGVQAPVPCAPHPSVGWHAVARWNLYRGTECVPCQINTYRHEEPGA